MHYLSFSGKRRCNYSSDFVELFGSIFNFLFDEISSHDMCSAINELPVSDTFIEGDSSVPRSKMFSKAIPEESHVTEKS